MDYQRFLAIVEGAAAIPRESAERAVRATLQTLAERIAGGEGRDLAEQLPPELAPWLATTSGAERFDVDAFLRRVAGREGTDVATAERHVRAVFTALGQAISADEHRARARAHDFMRPYLQLPNYVNNLRELGYDEADFADGGSDRLVDAIVAWGDEGAIADRVRAHRLAGADHVAIQPLAAEIPQAVADLTSLAPVLLGRS